MTEDRLAPFVDAKMNEIVESLMSYQLRRTIYFQCTILPVSLLICIHCNEMNINLKI